MKKSLFEDLKSVSVLYRGKFVLAFFMVLISNCLLILNPLVFRHAIIAFDPNLPKSEGLLNAAFNWILGPAETYLLIWVFLLIAISFTAAYFKYRMRVEFIAISRYAEQSMRSALFQRIQNQSVAFFDQHPPGELMSRLTNDIAAYREVLGPGIMYPMNFLTLTIPAFISLFSLSIPLAIVSLLPLIFIPFLLLLIRSRIYNTSLSIQKGLAEMSNITHETFSGIRIVKSYLIGGSITSRFKILCHRMIGLNMLLASLQGMFFPFLTLITKVVTVLLVLVSGYLIIDGWSSLNAADFISFMWIQSYIFIPVIMLGWVLPTYERGRAAYDRLLEIYNAPIEVQNPLNSNLHIIPRDDILFSHLTFSYPQNPTPVLRDFSLYIAGGSFVGITGPVGAGKSTLFRLLNRDYEIPRGTLTIGGNTIQEYSLKAIRKALITVEQTPFLFSKTISENVKFGAEDASQSELEFVAKMADVHDTVLTFPNRYDTMVGERGMTLSGGQKQRLAMARAFLVNRSILLLDDIFSAVDPATEKRIFHALKKHFEGKTVILITHRISILEQLDRILYMQNGMIIEDGTHGALVAKQGPYAALVELQRMTNDKGS